MKIQTYIKIIILAVAMTSGLYAQVGVNNTNPKSVFDIESGNPAAPANIDGLIVPRIDAFPLVNPGANQDGMLVFLTTATPSHKKGHHSWDNTAGEWQYFAGEWVDGYNGSNTDITYVKQAYKENEQDVVILDIGRIGMGTDSPDESLEIKLPGDNDIQIASNGTRPNAPNFIFYTVGNTFTSEDYANDNDPIGSLAGTVWNGTGESNVVSYITSTADGDHSSGNLPSRFNFSTTGVNNTSADTDGMEMTIRASGNVGIGEADPTAILHIKAGTATANSAPIKLNSGTNLSTPEAGAFEYDGTHLYFTKTASRAIVLKTLTNTANLDFLPLIAGLHGQLTVNVPGATAGSSCDCAPVGSLENGLVWSCFVSGANTVSVRLSNITGAPINPAPKNWIVTVIE